MKQISSNQKRQIFFKPLTLAAILTIVLIDYRIFPLGFFLNFTTNLLLVALAIPIHLNGGTGKPNFQFKISPPDQISNNLVFSNPTSVSLKSQKLKIFFVGSILCYAVTNQSALSFSCYQNCFQVQKGVFYRARYEISLRIGGNRRKTKKVLCTRLLLCDHPI